MQNIYKTNISKCKTILNKSKNNVKHIFQLSKEYVTHIKTSSPALRPDPHQSKTNVIRPGSKTNVSWAEQYF